MNKKYLFGMLVSGAMLAACTADDLNTAPVAQKANPSAPVFTVSLDNGDGLQNRALWNPGYKVGFEKDDVLSLYHGASLSNNQLGGYQNAIYKGGYKKDAAGNDTEVFEFTTQALVQPGKAIMIYPADTTFQTNTGADPVVIKLPDVQDNLTKVNKTPYISEVLDITAYGKVTDKTSPAEAGYGRDYDVVLRRVAGILTVTMDTDNEPVVEGVDPVEIKEVTLESSVEKTFTTSVPVKAIAATHAKDNPSWLNNSDLDVDNATGSKKFSTTDVENKVATFTMLPTSADLTNAEGSIVVRTTYGNVKIDKTATVWVNPTSTSEADALLNTGVVLDRFMKGIYTPSTDNNSVFKGEKVGKHLSATLKVDMKNINMNNMHIDTEEELMTALKVYDVLYAERENKKVTFNLDGDDDGKFYMSEETWREVENRVTDEENEITFQLCYDEAPCTIVNLSTEGTDVEIPVLSFLTRGKYIKETTKLELDGKWKFECALDKDGNPVAKTIGGINEVVVLAGSNLKLTGTVKAAATQDKAIKLVIAKDATAETEGTADVDMKLENHGKITIEEGTKLRAAANGEIENCAVAAGKDITGLTTGCGEILNKGTLGLEKETGNGQVNNYGLITIEGTTAVTFVTTNGDGLVVTGSKISQAFADDNRIGTIELPNATGNNLTTINGNPGFIKLNINKKNPTLDDLGTLANYIILQSVCTELSATNTVGGKAENTFASSKVKYIETSNKNVQMKGEFELKGLIVKAGNVQILNGAKITMDATDAHIYLKGTIDQAGDLLQGTSQVPSVIFKGYFGGAEEDAKNITIHKN